jgi:hypothetical protein
MKEHPILFSTAMVQALLAGRKTQTRRVVKFPLKVPMVMASIGDCDSPPMLYCCKWQAGDMMYVRETWQHTDCMNLHRSDENAGYIYKASENGEAWESSDENWHWKPSIHLPKDGSRIWLQIESVKVERVQGISEDDAIAEGVQENLCDDPAKCPSVLKGDICCGKGEYFRYPVDFDDEPCYSAQESFQTLWQSINGRESWDANPWVWVVSFKVLSTTGKPEFPPF